jgi:hypothetical protein
VHYLCHPKNKRAYNKKYAKKFEAGEVNGVEVKKISKIFLITLAQAKKILTFATPLRRGEIKKRDTTREGKRV